MRDTRLLQRLGILPTPKNQDFRTTRIDGAALSHAPIAGISPSGTMTPLKPKAAPKPHAILLPKPAPTELVFETMSAAQRHSFAEAWRELSYSNLATIKTDWPERYELLKKCFDWSLDAVPSNAKWSDLTPRQLAYIAANDSARFHRMLKEHRSRQL